MDYRGKFNGSNFRSVIKYEPTEKAKFFVQHIWLYGSVSENNPEPILNLNLGLVMTDGSRKEFRNDGNLEELLEKADKWIDENLPS